MENPEKEIADVVNLVTAAVNPEIQKIAVLKYYASDAGFSHPICRVIPGPGSRQLILGILRWYRVMSPIIKIEVRNVTYNADTLELFVEAVQIFHIRYSPFRGHPSRLLVHLYLKPSVDDPGLLQIAQHEDFYHPADVAALVLPPLIPIVHLLLWFGTIFSVVGARFFQIVFGFWTVKDGEGGKGVKLVNEESRSNGKKHIWSHLR